MIIRHETVVFIPGRKYRSKTTGINQLESVARMHKGQYRMFAQRSFSPRKRRNDYPLLSSFIDYGIPTQYIHLSCRHLLTLLFHIHVWRLPLLQASQMFFDTFTARRMSSFTLFYSCSILNFFI